METKESLNMVETRMEFTGMGKRDLRIFTQPLVLRGEEVVLLALEDITEARQHEQTLMEKERLATVVQMAGAVCHEMGQPLMVIQGFSELLAEDLGDEETLRSNILEIKNQVQRLGDITRKLSRLGQYRTKGYLGSKIIDIGAASNENTDKNKGIRER
jgi:signal transduction histidine kinase